MKNKQIIFDLGNYAAGRFFPSCRILLRLNSKYQGGKQDGK
jgi:hypothetical protein